MTRADTVIRKAEPGDAAALARLAESTFRAAFGDVNTRANMDAFCAAAFGEAIQAREIVDPAMETIVVESGGELVAYAQLRRDRTPSCVSGSAPIEIQRFYVDARRHGTGLARELMSRLLADARAGGADTMWLGVWEHNPRAIAFYRRCGFTGVGDQLFRLGDDVQRDLVMVLPLDAAAATSDRVRAASTSEPPRQA